MTGPARGVPDAGNSAERTRLAWRRTVLATAVVALLTVRLAVHSGPSALGWLGALGALVLPLVTAVLAGRRLGALGARPPVPAARLWPLALAVVAHACLTCLLVVLP